MGVYGLSSGSSSVPGTTPQGWMDLYVTFSKPAWSLGLILLNLLCFTREGGVFQWILERPIFGYLGKLSYSMYLLHPTVLLVMFGGRTAPGHYSIVNFVVNYV